MQQCPRCSQIALTDAGVCISCGYSESKPTAAVIPTGGGRDPFLFRTIGKDFYIRSPLGEGGFAKVYIADQTSLQRRAVVKILRQELSHNPQIIERFRQEAQLAARLSHPGIAKIFAIGEIEEDKLPFFAMEYIAGRPLSKILKAEGGLEMKRAARLLCLIAEAIDHAHENGVIHRDLKPDNIMVTTRSPLPNDPPGAHENIKILDFGIAKEEGNDADTGQTKSGEVLGTPYYMSPEQSNGDIVTRATDLYSMGAMAYEMFTGKVPFDGPSAGSILMQHISTPPPKLEDLSQKRYPAALEGAIWRALAKHPTQRHSSAKEFAAAVAHAVDAKVTFKLSDLAPPPPVTYETSFQSQNSQIRDSGRQFGGDSKSTMRIASFMMITLLAGLIVVLWTNNQKEKNSTPTKEDVSHTVPEPVHQPQPKLTPSKPNAGASLPAGADLATVPPLPAKKANLPAPNTRLTAEIPEGIFLFGEAKTPVFISKFYIDAYEVTVEEYTACVTAKKCVPAEQYLGFRSAKTPIVGVSYQNAFAYCAWEKKRLPTEAEWEKAARGDTAFLYPWGDEITCNHANYGGATDAKSCRAKNPAHTAEIRSYPDGVSSLGVFDMAGNVWEWTSDKFEANYDPMPPGKDPKKFKLKDPKGPEGEGPRVLKGGSWRDEAEALTINNRKEGALDLRSPEVGFRCVRSE
jgi:serine/threonine protein kinase